MDIQNLGSQESVKVKYIDAQNLCRISFNALV